MSLMHVSERSTLPQKYQVLPWLSWSEHCTEERWKLKEVGQARRDKAKALLPSSAEVCTGAVNSQGICTLGRATSGSSRDLRASRIC